MQMRLCLIKYAQIYIFHKAKQFSLLIVKFKYLFLFEEAHKKNKEIFIV